MEENLVGEVGRSLHDSLVGLPKAKQGRCKGCGSSMELYELDFRRSTKVMKCTRCGMLHVYRKDIIGKWRLLRAQKPELPQK